MAQRSNASPAIVMVGCRRAYGRAICSVSPVRETGSGRRSWPRADTALTLRRGRACYRLLLPPKLET